VRDGIQNADDQETKGEPRCSNCSFAVHLGPHVKTTAGMIPTKVKHEHGKEACATCSFKPEREKLLFPYKSRKTLVDS